MTYTFSKDKNFLYLQPDITVDLLTTALAEEIKKASFAKAIIGLSGGVDSALSLSLAVQALGKENVLAVFMPSQESSSTSLTDVESMVHEYGVELMVIDITTQIKSYFDSLKLNDEEIPPIRKGNKMARERMSILYDLSYSHDSLVIGTSNRTELLLGYGTHYGDSASAINPLGDLYKTQIWQLASYIGLPKNILNKPPSADLWPGQTDEQELGFSYHDIDRLLYYMIDLQYSLIQLRSLKFKDDFITKVSNMIIKNQYKRTLPIIIKLTRRTLGIDFRYLRDWGL